MTQALSPSDSKYILAALAERYPFDYANGALEFAVRALEAVEAGLDVRSLRPVYAKFVHETRIAPGKFRRSPSNPMQSSHDEWLGMAALSAIFDDGAVAREILTNIHCRELKLWKTGMAHDSFRIFNWTISIDSEWFTFWRPEYRAVMKLAAGQSLSLVEKLALRLNLRFSTTWNLLRARILLLKYLKYNTRFADGACVRMGLQYRGRYGNEPIINALWRLQDEQQ